ncbi:MAG: DNA/RNA non-specific endonuclease [Bacteroidota bacterium]|nr:DNA/RNA non-specific endonuclease [Bacteroidota bacterium]
MIFPKIQQGHTTLFPTKVTDTAILFSENFYPSISENEQLVRHSAFSLSYSEEHEQAKWVAYLLSSPMCNNKGEERSNNFRADKSIRSGSAKPEEYKKSGFDRGHLCPAGDMGWSEQSMSESFLMSNMSPQVPPFNRGIWKRLETQVRTWAIQNEEIYVVTGGVLNEHLQKMGASCISIPEYYYKVILDYKEPHLKAIAFILPNQGSKESFYECVVSIDSVEQLTGLNFFPALPDSLETNLEKSSSLKGWCNPRHCNLTSL